MPRPSKWQRASPARKRRITETMKETEHHHPNMGPCDYSCSPYREAKRKERQTRDALNEAMRVWSESLTREDVEEDPRSLAHRAFLAGWQAGREFERQVESPT